MKLLVNFIGKKGGGAVYSLEMTKAFVNSGQTVSAILSSNIENREDWDRLNLDKTIYLKGYRNKIEYMYRTIMLVLFGKKKIKRILNGEVFDFIYVPMIQPWTNVINSIFKNTKTVVTAHDPKPHLGTGTIFKLICKRAIQNSDHIVILSSQFKDWVSSTYNKDKTKIHVIEHGIFDYYKTKKCVDNFEIYKKDTYNFLFFGRITPYKGLDLLLKAYSKIKNQRSDVTLTIVGSGDVSAYMNEILLLDDVKLINRWIKDEEVNTFFNHPNLILVLPYIEASQSGVIPIAMAYRVLVIASNTGGLTEQIEHKKTGLLFKTMNIDDLFLNMLDAISNYESYNFILDEAEHYISNLTWDKLAQKLISQLQ